MKTVPLSEEKRMRIIGRIDRIDKVEKDGSTYLKILDYKSGNNQFDPVSLYYGTQLQLAVYLHAALILERQQKEQRGESGEVIPAAILYYHMQDPFVERSQEQMSDEMIEAQRMDAMRMDGLVNEQEECIAMLDASFDSHSDVIPVERKKSGGYTSASKVADSDQFEVISNYVEQKMVNLAAEILSGRKAVDPYERGGRSACTYCEFASLCKYDEKIPGYQKRELDSMTKEEAMQNMRKAIE
ncbi:MAG: PD-(D/E)XK nuclease family protein, partial [Lachnospiraceae bacterium]|nr:PD-(D/E)XK nuclease family protein [Lachnospiraceae bacterium]